MTAYLARGIIDYIIENNPEEVKFIKEVVKETVKDFIKIL